MKIRGPKWLELCESLRFHFPVTETAREKGHSEYTFELPTHRPHGAEVTQVGQHKNTATVVRLRVVELISSDSECDLMG